MSQIGVSLEDMVSNLQSVADEFRDRCDRLNAEFYESVIERVKRWRGYLAADMPEEAIQFDAVVPKHTGDEHCRVVYASDYEELLAFTLQLVAENASLRKNDARYQWVRQQHWSDSAMCCVQNPKEAVKPGTFCPSGEYLDDLVDEGLARGPR